MQRLESPNRWSCLPTALAMVVGESVEKVLEVICHDGSETCWPQYPEPFCRRGFALNEISYAAFRFGFALCEIAQDIIFHPYGHINEYEEMMIAVPETDWENKMLQRYDAILLGENHSKVSHAVAWDSRKQLIHDPNGTMYQLSVFRRESILLAVRLG